MTTIKRLEIARKAEVDPVTIHRYKTGKSFPNLYFFECLDELAFEKIGKHVNSDWVIFGRGEPFIDDESITGGDQINDSNDYVKETVIQNEEAVKQAEAQINAIKLEMLEKLEQVKLSIVGKFEGVAFARLFSCKQFVNTLWLE
ncbi:hypothetical protein [Chondrinema litorale]|uniref:hypothetical protein n=1 Tax=Chondrinema litorale TaxID=2994555 RepID=UPI002543B9B6|nr:hypothetical protein [Chondrinema litorale]UZR93171.1 hypothetical protein OQ292_15025 [Chondrinema litorale]